MNLELTLEDMAIFARIESTRAKLVYADGDNYDASTMFYNRKLKPRGGPNYANRKLSHRSRLVADGWFRVDKRWTM